MCRASCPGFEFLFLGSLWVFCTFGASPVWGHNLDVPKLDQTHNVCTPSPVQTQNAAGSMRTTKPHQTQLQDAIQPARGLKGHLSHTKRTPSAHQEHAKPTSSPQRRRPSAHTSSHQTHKAANAMCTPWRTPNPDQTQKAWRACAAHEGADLGAPPNGFC